MPRHPSDNSIAATQINDDCLLYIFRLLPFEAKLTFSRVCKRWRYFAKMYWRLPRIDVEFNESLCDEDYDEKSNSWRVSDYNLIMEICGSSIQETFFDFSSVTFYRLILNLVKLEFNQQYEIKIPYRMYNSKVNFERNFTSMFSKSLIHATQLKKLVLQLTPSLNFDVQNLSELKNLYEIHISHAGNTLTDEDLEKIGSFCVNIKRLIVKNCSGVKKTAFIFSFQNLVFLWLESLQFQKSEGLRNTSSIKELVIKKCKYPKATLHELIKAMPFLLTLHFNSSGDVETLIIFIVSHAMKRELQHILIERIQFGKNAKKLLGIEESSKIKVIKNGAPRVDFILSFEDVFLKFSLIENLKTLLKNQRVKRMQGYNLLIS